MARLFLGVGGKTYPRTQGHGYNELKLDADLKIPSIARFATEDRTLTVYGDGEQDGTESYTFMCKEFGLYGYRDRSDIYAKVSVILCDDGWMLVTLLDGTLLLDLDDQLVQPTTGERSAYPSVRPANIYWVNQDTLLGHKAYFGSKFACVNTQDYEYVFELHGGVYDGLSSFSMRAVQEEYVDLSQGYTAQCEYEEQQKQAARRARKLVTATVNTGGSSVVELDFDEDDADDDSYFMFDDEDEGEIVDN